MVKNLKNLYKTKKFTKEEALDFINNTEGLSIDDKLEKICYALWESRGDVCGRRGYLCSECPLRVSQNCDSFADKYPELEKK